MATSLLARTSRDPVRPVDFGLLANQLTTLCNAAFKRHSAGQFAEAVRLYEGILRLKSDLPDIHNNLGHALSALGRPLPATHAFARAVELKPDFPEALCNWGLALAELERHDEAEAKYRQAIALNPDFAGAHNNLGLVLKAAGRLTEAKRAFKQAIALSPKDFSIYHNLAAVRSFSAGDRYVAALERAARDTSALSGTDQMHLHFALAKANDDLSRPEYAFAHLMKANWLKRRQVAYDEAATLHQMDRLRELIGRDFIRARQSSGERSALPVFIVGMTRSGTTLIEQILASHPQVFGAGEVPVLNQVAGAIQKLQPSAPIFPDTMLHMSPADYCALGSLYLDRMMEISDTALRITDKMTLNFLFVGLIHLALPDATIIHAVRDPADTCLSSFLTHFTNGNEHTYDLAELGRYYRHYQQVMAHWHAVLPPGRILDVRYEDLVADVETAARRLIAHCGLDWDPRCLDFHHTERPVTTASAAQVRQPIYKNSVERWRKYEPFLAPLFAELEPIGG